MVATTVEKPQPPIALVPVSKEPLRQEPLSQEPFHAGDATVSSPFGRAALAQPARRAMQSLGQSGVTAVALTFVDNAGITRVKTAPLARFETVAQLGLGMSPVFDVFLVDDSITSSPHVGGPTGDLRLLPDVGQLVALAGQPGWAWAPADRFSQDGTEHPVCQRSFARRMVRAALAAGVEFRMGYEIEWAISRSDAGGDEFVPACDGPAYGMTRVVELSDYSREVLDALARQGVVVDQFHPEYASAQFELSVAPADPVTAADLNVLARQTIRAVGLRHGLRVSFAPAVVPGTVGNGGHLHLSAWADGRNLLGDRAERGESLLAGLLAAMPALCAVGAPSVASYLRLVPSRWAGCYQCWGRENREAAVRLISGPVGGEASAGNAELKCFDLAANPYLVVGAVIAVAIDALDAGLRLPAEMPGDPAALGDAELARRGVRRLPTALPAAADALENNKVLREAMGDPLFLSFLAVRRAEAELFAGQEPADVVAATRWRY
jgi:glutamine synthetase